MTIDYDHDHIIIFQKFILFVKVAMVMVTSHC